MTIKNSEGKILKISSPNTLMKNQSIWKNTNIEYINITNIGKKILLNSNKIKKNIIENKIKKNQLKIIQKETINNNSDKQISDEIEEMTIYNKDGTPYEAKGIDGFKNYRPGSPDIDQLNNWDIEQINLAGSPVIYYKTFIDSDFDDVYMEVIDKVTQQQGYKIYAKFEPIVPEQNLSEFGIDSPDEMRFEFNLRQWREKIKEMPSINGLIFCEWDSTWWEIIQNNQGEPYMLWEKYRLIVVAKKYQPSRGETHPTRKDAVNKDGELDISINKSIY